MAEAGADRAGAQPAEEAVLAGCKLSGASGPPSAVDGCRKTNKNGVCQTRDCSQYVTS